MASFCISYRVQNSPTVSALLNFSDTQESTSGCNASLNSMRYTFTLNALHADRTQQHNEGWVVMPPVCHTMAQISSKLLPALENNPSLPSNDL